MRETPIKSFYFAVVEKVTNIKTLEGPEGLFRAGDKELILVEFADENDYDAYMKKLREGLDATTEAFRILANQDTQFELQRLVDELDFEKRRREHIPLPDAGAKK